MEFGERWDLQSSGNTVGDNWPDYQHWGAWRPVQELCAAGRLFHDRGWSVGTSSNYSVVLNHDPLRLLITVSGKDKGALTANDFLIVDGEGKSLFPAAQTPSAETMLHCVLAKERQVGAVLHVHGMWGVLQSELHLSRGYVEIEGFEMLKGLAGVKTHRHKERVAIVENTQDIYALSQELAPRLRKEDESLKHGFLMHRHGLYTWGKDVFEARRHVEILEYLFELACRRRQLGLPD